MALLPKRVSASFSNLRTTRTMEKELKQTNRPNYPFKRTRCPGSSFQSQISRLMFRCVHWFSTYKEQEPDVRSFSIPSSFLHLSLWAHVASVCSHLNKKEICEPPNCFSLGIVGSDDLRSYCFCQLQSSWHLKPCNKTPSIPLRRVSNILRK